MDINAGSTYRVKYPFYRGILSLWEDEGLSETESWFIGTRSESIYPDDCEAVADGEGEMVLTVVDTFKPGKFPTRVFFTRKYIDPDGKEFGKNNLHIMVTSAFKRRAAGFMYEYRLAV